MECQTYAEDDDVPTARKVRRAEATPNRHSIRVLETFKHPSTHELQHGMHDRTRHPRARRKTLQYYSGRLNVTAVVYRRLRPVEARATGVRDRNRCAREYSQPLHIGGGGSTAVKARRWFSYDSHPVEVRAAGVQKRYARLSGARLGDQGLTCGAAARECRIETTRQSFQRSIRQQAATPSQNNMIR